jgi:hypothetical protein
MKKNGKRPHTRSNGNHRQTAGKTAANGNGHGPPLIPQPHGGALLAGGQPGNRGGGRISERLLEMGDASADFIQRTRDGEITYFLRGICSECKKESKGPKEFGDLLKLIPSPDTRLRAAEIPIKYTIGREKTIRIEGFRGAERAFSVVRQKIRQKLGTQLAEELIQDIILGLKEVQ